MKSIRKIEVKFSSGEDKAETRSKACIDYFI